MITSENKTQIKILCNKGKTIKEIYEITNIPYLSIKGFVYHNKINHKTNKVNLKNQKFGRLTVIEHSKIKNQDNKKLWKCLCLCGGVVFITAAALLRGDTKSCGCLKKELSSEMCKRTNVNHHAWKGMGEMPGSYYRSVIFGANKRDIEFSLNIEQLWEIFLKQDKKCVYTGRKLTFNTSSKTHDGTASLDRIDSSKGYIDDNVQWVHKDINKMKLSHKEKDFLDIIKEVYEYRNLL